MYAIHLYITNSFVEKKSDMTLTSLKFLFSRLGQHVTMIREKDKKKKKKKNTDVYVLFTNGQ